MPIISQPDQITCPNTWTDPIGGRSPLTSPMTESTRRNAPIANRATPATRWATPTERKNPYGYLTVGGFAMMRTATRKAIGGARESRSSIHAAFIACELPMTR